MTISLSSICSFFAFIRWIIQKAITFKSFTGVTVQEFDEIYEKEIAKKYYKHEIKRLLKERIGAIYGRR